MDNKTMVFDTSFMKNGEKCKDEEKQFRDYGFTWFHEDGDYAHNIFPGTKEPKNFFKTNKSDWLLYEGNDKKHDLFL